MYDLEDQAAKFEQLVQILVPSGFHTALYTEQTQSGKPNKCVMVTNENDEPVLKIFLFASLGNPSGPELHFIYDLRTVDGVEVLPVMLPSDAVDALTRIRRAYRA